MPRQSRHQIASSNPNDFAPGQRWISEMQPELGLGLIIAAGTQRVQVIFPASEQTLTYAARSAPLRRVEFSIGDTVRNQQDEASVVADIRKDEGRLIYIDAAGNELPESELSDKISFQKPEARLLAGHVDDPRTWKLRQAARRFKHEARSRKVRGLVGARISLIPHQLYIANEVASRFAPRVLLADEVGLGKTIEACLILHRLHQSGRASRILILVPDALINQWFVELYRRFQMSFSIYDEERAKSIEAGEGAGNPFFDDQLVICGTSWLADNPERAMQAAEGNWDLLIVDEAHHLEWTTQEASPAYEAVAGIAMETPGLLLLTATPEQLGREGHFARLRLLDPDRFSDLAEFIKESDHYQEVSALADNLRSGDKLKKAEEKLLKKMLGAEAVEKLSAAQEDETAEAEATEAKVRKDLAASLVDLYGTGRVMFRNRRQVLEGFPKRQAHLWPLVAKEDSDETADKILWLSTLLSDNPDDKFLLICHSQQMAEKIEEALREHISAMAAVFHEGLNLLQRDRNAAYFADEGGARILICSEIGSEGRNFQFAHHLILFDLPPDPALLEQRIGRLDRIGQEEDIHIHVPYLAGSGGESLAKWYHEGLAAFEHTLHGSSAIEREFQDELQGLLTGGKSKADLADLIERGKAFKEQVDHDLEKGRDHLLEISSFDKKRGGKLVKEIKELDEDRGLQRFVLRLFDHFGVTVEDLDDRCYMITPEHLFSPEAFPGLPEEGISLTFDRETALAREDIVLFTWDHPMVTSAIDVLLGSERGNASFARIEAAPEQALLLDIVCVLECVAPEKFHADRFLPSQPVRALVDHQLRDRSNVFVPEMIRRSKEGPTDWLQKKSKALRGTLPKMIEAAKALAEKNADEVRKEAVEAMEKQLDGEIERLEKLREMGHPVRDSEIQLATEERDALKGHLQHAVLRMDSVRMILATPGT
ncbi:MAG: SNF2-related protein [Verrucomicrobiales bacterium]|nr:SNF2-related protein [Verrucomicrobiales bacterium]